MTCFLSWNEWGTHRKSCAHDASRGQGQRDMIRETWVWIGVRLSGEEMTWCLKPCVVPFHQCCAGMSSSYFNTTRHDNRKRHVSPLTNRNKQVLGCSHIRQMLSAGDKMSRRPAAMKQRTLLRLSPALILIFSVPIKQVRMVICYIGPALNWQLVQIEPLHSQLLLAPAWSSRNEQKRRIVRTDRRAAEFTRELLVLTKDDPSVLHHSTC